MCGQCVRYKLSDCKLRPHRRRSFHCASEDIDLRRGVPQFTVLWHRVLSVTTVYRAGMDSFCCVRRQSCGELERLIRGEEEEEEEGGIKCPSLIIATQRDDTPRRGEIHQGGRTD